MARKRQTEAVITNAIGLKKKRKKEYWSIEQEDAVREFLTYEPGSLVADKLFSTMIYPSLRQLVENIAFTYHLTTPETPVREQIDDCIGHVIVKFRKFNPEHGSKSFSYYGTVAKNYFILAQNKAYKKRIKTTEIDNTEGLEILLDLAVDHEFERGLDSPEFFIMHLADHVEGVLESDISLHTNTWKLGEAIVYILRNYAHIQMGTKNTFYHIVREMTGLTTKEISKALKDVKPLYAGVRDEFLANRTKR